MSQDDPRDATATRALFATSGKCGYYVTTQLTPVSQTDSVSIYVDMRPIIPVVFLPGIMGSNLKNSFGDSVWNPDDKSATASNFFPATSPEARQTLLDQWNTEVDWGIAPNEADFEAYTRYERGWGSVYGGCYHSFLERLSQELNHVMYRGKISPAWQSRLAEPLPRGMSPTMQRFEEEGLNTLAKYRFEVWVCGYNWLRGNEESARDVMSYIRDTVLPHYANNPHVPLATNKQVLLVTHSMGGLVARSLCRRPGGQDLILGVIHGAMPANGAADAYLNVRRGMKGFQGIVIGSNADNLDAVYLQCQGGLELLPFGQGMRYNPQPADSRTASPPELAHVTVPGTWLFTYDREDPQGQICAPPSGMDIYEHIYKSSEWYGVLPRFNEHLFDPAGIVRRQFPRETRRKILEKFINWVKYFHTSIAGFYHPQSYAFWGNGGDTAAPGEVLWEYDGRNFRYSVGELDSGTGNYQYGKNMFTLTSISHHGDETVPRASWAKDLGRIRGFCCLGGHEDDPHGFSHQDAFNDPRSLEACLLFVSKLVQAKARELQC